MEVTKKLKSSEKKKLDDAEEDGLDHFTNLPTDVFRHNILSLLPTEDVARVSLVSKECRSLCCPFPIVDFDFKRSKKSRLYKKADRFAKFADYVMVLHEGLQLEKLRLAIDISKYKAQDSVIIDWFAYAININLTALDLDIRDRGEIDEYGGRNVLHGLLASMHNITRLTITSPYLQVTPPDEALEKVLEGLSAGKVQELLPAPWLPNLTHLTLKYSTLLYGFASLASFLRFSPHLETLCIDVNRKSVGKYDSYVMDPIEETNMESYFPSDGLLHLKIVEIKGFEGRGFEMFFLRYLMKKALALKEIIIYKDAMNRRYDSLKYDGYETKLKLLEKQKQVIDDVYALKKGSNTRARILLAVVRPSVSGNCICYFWK